MPCDYFKELRTSDWMTMLPQPQKIYYDYELTADKHKMKQISLIKDLTQTLINVKMVAFSV